MKANGTGNLFGMLGDVVGGLIDQGADELGLSPQVKEAAKMGIGIFMGNEVMAAKGAAALASTRGMSESPAATEMYQGEIMSSPAGYSSPPCSSSAPGRRELMKFDTDAVLNWTPSGSPEADDLNAMRARFDLTKEKPVALGLQGGKSDYIQYLTEQLRSFPQLRQQFEKEFGVKIDLNAYDQKNGMVVFRNASAAAQAQGTTPPPGGTPSPAQGSTSAAAPTAGATAPTAGSGHLDPNITGYQDCLNTLLENWEVFDTAMGKKDCLISKENLEAISNFPSTSPELKKAAQFLIQHEEYFNRLEMACGVGGKDGIISQGDVAADLKKVNQEIATFGPPSVGTSANASTAANSGTGAAQTASDAQDIVGGTGGTNPFAKIFGDSSLSIEEKIQSVLEQALSTLDNDIEAATKALGDRPSETQLREYQRLIERRTRMFTLISDMSAKFNEMSKTAIQNMSRA